MSRLLLDAAVQRPRGVWRIPFLARNAQAAASKASAALSGTPDCTNLHNVSRQPLRVTNAKSHCTDLSRSARQGRGGATGATAARTQRGTLPGHARGLEPVDTRHGQHGHLGCGHHRASFSLGGVRSRAEPRHSERLLVGHHGEYPDRATRLHDEHAEPDTGRGRNRHPGSLDPGPLFCRVFPRLPVALDRRPRSASRYGGHPFRRQQQRCVEPGDIRGEREHRPQGLDRRQHRAQFIPLADPIPVRTRHRGLGNGPLDRVDGRARGDRAVRRTAPRERRAGALQQTPSARFRSQQCQPADRGVRWHHGFHPDLLFEYRQGGRIWIRLREGGQGCGPPLCTGAKPGDRPLAEDRQYARRGRAYDGRIRRRHLRRA